MPLSPLYNYNGIVLLAPETILAAGAVVYGAWTTINSATLGALPAQYAYVSIQTEVEDAGDVRTEVNCYLRQTGSGLATSDLTLRSSAQAQSEAAANTIGSDMTQCLIALDAVRDFDYYAEQIGAPDVSSVHIELLGYVPF